jgi:hypothetical protein
MGALGKNNRDKTTPKPTPKIARMINTWLLITIRSIDAEIDAGSIYYLSSIGGSIAPVGTTGGHPYSRAALCSIMTICGSENVKYQNPNDE